MNNYVSSLLLAATLGVPYTVHANPASTDYVNQRISEAVTTLTNTLKSEINRLSSQITSQRIQTHGIGERYQGGVIFFVDDSGLHGLIAALRDANNGETIQWQNGVSGEKIVNARANGLGAGESNTRLIISQETIDDQSGHFAALAALSYAVIADGTTPCSTTVRTPTSCYGGWYLPSIYELDLLRRNLPAKYQLAQVPYWSSTESSVTESWAEEVVGTPILLDKSSDSGRVRAIRSF